MPHNSAIHRYVSSVYCRPKYNRFRRKESSNGLGIGPVSPIGVKRGAGAYDGTQAAIMFEVDPLCSSFWNGGGSGSVFKAKEVW